MDIRKIAAAAGFATGAALTFAPLASADASSSWWSSIDSLLGAAAPALTSAPVSDFQISFNGMDLFPTTGNLATATTAVGQFGLAIAYGNGANATAEGGTGDYAMASGTNALAMAGSTQSGATGFNFDSAIDIGNNTAGVGGVPDGAYAGGASLIGGTDSGASSNDTAIDIGNNTAGGGQSGAFAGDGLLTDATGAGNGDTAYTFGNTSGIYDGSAAVGGNNDFASSSGNETGLGEGAFATVGNNNVAIADTNYSVDNAGVGATDGNGNFAYVSGPDNSTALAGGENAGALAGNNNIAYVSDPFGAAGSTDSAVAGSSSTAAGSNDLAEVLYTHGNAAAQGGNSLYDILSLFGNAHSASLPAAVDAGAGATGAAADPAATLVPITTTVSGEVSSLNSIFTTDATLFGVGNDLIAPTAGQPFETISLAGAPDTAPFNSFDYFLYGLNPAANAVDDPGAYDLFNGSLAEFSNAYNVELFSLLNPGVAADMIPAADIIGSHADFLTGSVSTAVTDFLTLGWNDLLGFF